MPDRARVRAGLAARAAARLVEGAHRRGRRPSRRSRSRSTARPGRAARPCTRCSSTGGRPAGRRSSGGSSRTAPFQKAARFAAGQPSISSTAGKRGIPPSIVSGARPSSGVVGRGRERSPPAVAAQADQEELLALDLSLVEEDVERPHVGGPHDDGRLPAVRGCAGSVTRLRSARASILQAGRLLARPREERPVPDRALLPAEHHLDLLLRQQPRRQRRAAAAVSGPVSATNGGGAGACGTGIAWSASRRDGPRRRTASVNSPTTRAKRAPSLALTQSSFTRSGSTPEERRAARASRRSGGACSSCRPRSGSRPGGSRAPGRRRRRPRSERATKSGSTRPGAGHAHDADVGRVGRAARAGQVGAGVAAPVAEEADDPGLERRGSAIPGLLLRHQRLGLARSPPQRHRPREQRVDLGQELLVVEAVQDDRAAAAAGGADAAALADGRVDLRRHAPALRGATKVTAP